MLVANTSAVNAYKLTSNVATYYTTRAHYFVTGQSVIVAGLPAPFTATVTVVDTNTTIDAQLGNFYFTAATQMLLCVLSCQQAQRLFQAIPLLIYTQIMTQLSQLFWQLASRYFSHALQPVDRSRVWTLPQRLTAWVAA